MAVARWRALVLVIAAPPRARAACPDREREGGVMPLSEIAGSSRRCRVKVDLMFEIFGIPRRRCSGIAGRADQWLVYALLSLGLAVIFGMLNIINFAHGAST